jgi:hypothetical protein
MPGEVSGSVIAVLGGLQQAHRQRLLDREVNVALRVCDHDALCLEQFADAVAHVAADLAQVPLARHIAPEVCLENQRIFAEIIEYDDRRRLDIDFLLLTNGLRLEIGAP